MRGCEFLRLVVEREKKGEAVQVARRIVAMDSVAQNSSHSACSPVMLLVRDTAGRIVQGAKLLVAVDEQLIYSGR